MRKSLQRALALAASVPVLSGSLLLAAPAAHAAMPTCASTPLVDFDLLGDNTWRLQVHAVSGTQTNICIQLHETIQAVVTVKSNVGATLPSVTPGSGAGACDTRIIDMNEPEDLSLSLGVSTASPLLCLELNGTAHTLTVGTGGIGALPDVEVWLPAYSYLNQWGNCGYYYAQWTATSDTDWYYWWQDCYQRDQQIL